MTDTLTIQLQKDLYEKDYRFITPDGKEIPITPAGSLSLMALGYKATIALRKARGWRFDNEHLIIPPFPHQKDQDNEKD